MATIRQNNIDFTNVNADQIFAVYGKFSKSANNDGTSHFDTTLTENEIGKSFNALEIDWNGADFENAPGTKPSTITTTGDLINAIKWSSVRVCFANC